MWVRTNTTVMGVIFVDEKTLVFEDIQPHLEDSPYFGQFEPKLAVHSDFICEPKLKKSIEEKLKTCPSCILSVENFITMRNIND